MEEEKSFNPDYLKAEIEVLRSFADTSNPAENSNGDIERKKSLISRAVDSFGNFTKEVAETSKEGLRDGWEKNIEEYERENEEFWERLKSAPGKA